MTKWRKSGCILCAQNCGLEILVEDGRMVKVRPDRDNPRSKGYACRKGMRILNYQYPSGRLTAPLKRVGKGFEEISWEQATTEIAAGMRQLVDSHGPKCLAYMGASSQGGHFEAAFGLSLLRALGSQYLYSSTGQEFSGAWWVFGRMLGKQYNIAIPDEQETEMLVGWGWNGMQSHQMPEAPRVLTEIAKNPDKLLVIIDPRRSETRQDRQYPPGPASRHRRPAAEGDDCHHPSARLGACRLPGKPCRRLCRNSALVCGDG